MEIYAGSKSMHSSFAHPGKMDHSGCFKRHFGTNFGCVIVIEMLYSEIDEKLKNDWSPDQHVGEAGAGCKGVAAGFAFQMIA